MEKAQKIKSGIQSWRDKDARKTFLYGNENIVILNIIKGMFTNEPTLFFCRLPIFHRCVHAVDETAEYHQPEIKILRE